MNEDFTTLPDNLTRPHDDGSANHLLGRRIPKLMLPSTKNDFLDLSSIDKKYCILYFFPMMATEKNLPLGWNEIPGARGCTPQNISFDKHRKDLQKHDAMAVGICSQSISELEQLSSLRGLSNVLISDEGLEFNKKLDVPTFDVKGKTFYKRLTLIVENSNIIKVFYPIFPPDKHIFEILRWLENVN